MNKAQNFKLNKRKIKKNPTVVPKGHIEKYISPQQVTIHISDGM